MNKRILVIYKSETGFTKQYAQWIADEISCDLKELKAVHAERLQKYDAVIFGGGLYAGGVSGMRQFVKWYPELRDKELILFTCGLANPNEPKNVEHMEAGIAKAIPADMYAQMKQFHLRGGIDYSKISPVHRIMMWMLCRTMKRRGYDKLSGDDKLMVDTYGKKLIFQTGKQSHRLLIMLWRETQGNAFPRQTADTMLFAGCFTFIQPLSGILKQIIYAEAER